MTARREVIVRRPWIKGVGLATAGVLLVGSVGLAAVQKPRTVSVTFLVASLVVYLTLLATGVRALLGRWVGDHEGCRVVGPWRTPRYVAWEAIVSIAVAPHEIRFRSLAGETIALPRDGTNAPDLVQLFLDAVSPRFSAEPNTIGEWLHQFARRRAV